jgi:hypothetical protein
MFDGIYGLNDFSALANWDISKVPTIHGFSDRLLIVLLSIQSYIRKTNSTADKECIKELESRLSELEEKA